MRQAIALFLGLIVILSVVASAITPIRAQENDLHIETAADYAYGQELRFKLQATEAGDVESLKLIVRPELSANQYVVDVPFVPGRSISVTQNVDVGVLDLRPFAAVDYAWQVGMVNDSVNLPQESFVYEDDRFGWRIMERNALAAHWIGGGPDFGQQVIDRADRTLRYLTELLPTSTMPRLDIYVYPSSADLRSALRVGEQEDPLSEPRSVGAALVTNVNEKTMADDLDQSVPHEVARVWMAQSAGSSIVRIPWWFLEGIALGARPQANPRQNQLLEEALQQGQTISLWRLCDPPQVSGDRAELAAAQSSSLVAYIHQNQPPGSIARLWSAYLGGADCAAGTERVLDLTLDELEKAWLSSHSATSVARSFWNDLGVWIVLFAGGTLLALVLLRTTLVRGRSR